MNGSSRVFLVSLFSALALLLPASVFAQPDRPTAQPQPVFERMQTVGEFDGAEPSVHYKVQVAAEGHLQKIQGQLQVALAALLDGAADAEIRQLAGMTTADFDGQHVTVEVSYTSPSPGTRLSSSEQPVRSALDKAGAEVLGRLGHGGLLVRIPLAQLAALAKHPEVARIMPARKAKRLAGSVTSEAHSMSRSDWWQTAGGFDGSGIKLAVIDGFDSSQIVDLQNSGDWPSDTNLTLKDFKAGPCSGFGCTGEDHGMAVLELAHDFVPQASFTAYDTWYVADWYEALLDAANVGNGSNAALGQPLGAPRANVVSVSLGATLDGIGDGSALPGSIAEAAGFARDNGVIVVNAAGNQGDSHWGGLIDPVPSGANSGYHRWGTGSNSSTYGGLAYENGHFCIPGGFSIALSLSWDDWKTNSSGQFVSDQDYSLHLYRMTSSNSYTQVAVSDFEQSGNPGNTPQEFISYTTGSFNTPGCPSGSVYTVRIRRKQGTSSSNYLQFFDEVGYGLLQYQTAPNSLGFPADSPNLITVGASNFSEPDQIEVFSSRGPVLGAGGTAPEGDPASDPNPKPDVIHHDFVSTVTYGSEEFGGTSAATPQVAGMVAQIIQNYGIPGNAAEVDSVKDIVHHIASVGANDLGDPGFDYTYGWGRLWFQKEDSLFFAEQPTDTPENDVITPNIAVGVRDDAGLLVRYGIFDSVDLAIDSNPPGTGVLSQTSAPISNDPVSGSSGGGIATFDSASIDTSGVGYTLKGSAGALSVTSNAFDILPPAVDGICGPADGGAFPSAPSEDLCAAGTPTAVGSSAGLWTWACEGIAGGLDAQCSATVQYTLTYTAGANGSISGPSPQTVDHGDDGVAVTAVPDTAYHFVDWSDGSTDNPRTYTNVQGNITVGAGIAVNTYAVTFLDWDSTVLKTEQVNHGDGATAPADPERTGYTFAGWDVAFDNVTSDLTVTAQYTINSYTLVYTAGANGSISGPSPQTVDHGDDGVAVTAVPDTGYHFVDWSDGSTDNPRTDTNVQGNITVEAGFSADQFTVTASSTGNGTIAPASQMVDYGGSASFTVTPDAGYQTDSVTGDTCTPVDGGNGSWTAGNIQADCAVTADFVAVAGSISTPVAAPVGVVAIVPEPDIDARKSEYVWQAENAASQNLNAVVTFASGNGLAQEEDLELEYFDPVGQQWTPLTLTFDAAVAEWSAGLTPAGGMPLAGGEQFQLRASFRRGGRYLSRLSLTEAASGLEWAASVPATTHVAEAEIFGAFNAAGQIGIPVESSLALANSGTAALSGGGAGNPDPEQPAHNNENVRGRFVISWDGGALTPADTSGPGGNCGAEACASPDVAIEYYDADNGRYENIFNLRQDADGESLYGHFGSLASGGLPLPAGYSASNLFRTTAKRHLGTYTVIWQVVGIDSGTVYAQADPQIIGMDTGDAASIIMLSGDGGTATVGNADYDLGDLVVEVRDIAGNPVPGATVAFNVLPGAEGAGAALSTPAVTDAAGQTSVAATSNDFAGIFEVQAELSSGAVLNQPFVLENLADDDADQVEISLHTGDGQTARVGTDYGLPLVAQVTDRFGNPLEGIDVSFADSGAGVTLANTSGNTDADGLVDTGTVTASTTAGAVTVSAVVDASQCTSDHCSADFSLENTAGGAASVGVSAAQSSAVVGTSEAYELTVTATDADGNPVPGVSVSLVGPGSGAGVEPAIHAGLTDAAGELLYSFDANTTAGAFEVQAVASGVAPASVGLENLAGDAAAIEQVSGSDQSAPVNSAFAEDLVVRVVDQYGNAVADDAAAEVSFVAPDSGPSASVAATATSGTDGLASTPATANGEAGSYSVVASFDSTDVNFALTNTTGEVEISDIVWTASGSDSVEWDGTPQVAQATVSGTSLEPEFTYNGSTAAPSDAGSYQVIASIDDGNVQGSASAMLTITPKEAGNTNIEIVGGAYTYDGFSHPATVSNPDGVGYALGYDTPDGQAPVDAGSWTATLEVTDPNYASETLTAAIEIGKVEPQLYLFDLEHDADGTVKSATVIVLPESLRDDVVVTYDPDTPRAAGSYEVTAVIEGHPNAEDASVSGTLVIHRESPCAIFCDRFEAVDDGLINLLPDRGTTQIRTTWSIPVPDSGRQQVVLELLNGSGREVAWIDTATTGQQQWLRLRHAGAGGEQRSDWLPWRTGAELGMEWGVNGNDDLVLRFVDGKGQPTGLELVVVKDSLLPHSVRQSGGH